MSLTLITLMSLASTPGISQNFEAPTEIQISWCVGSKVVNDNGVVTDCRSTGAYPKCKEISRPSAGGRVVISAQCVR